MCTIGCVFDGDVVRTFKQCDLTKPTEFYEPEVARGAAGHYLAFRRQGRPGVWAGVNEHGVGFVAADYYTNEDPGTPQVTAPARFFRTSTLQEPNDDVDRLFRAYEASIADHATAKDAIDYLKDWYLTQGDPGNPHPNFKSPDIVLISDRAQAFFLEYYPGPAGISPSVKTLSPQAGGWFASTNHARMFPETVDYSKNHSTYLRLARAEAILGAAPTAEGIKTVLQDQYYGETELSICRVAGQQGEYFTQATVILNASRGEVWAEYLINGNPRTKPYTARRL